jgi:hypothetical protein
MKNTLHDLNIYLADKQKGLINNLTEGNPIVGTIPVKKSSHGTYNVHGKVTDIAAMQQVDYDEELPTVGISFDLGRTSLGKIGGKLPMPRDAAKEMGGYAKYADDRCPTIIAKSANDNENRIYYQGFLAYAIANSKVVSVGGTTADSQYSMVFAHYDMDSTVGLYNPNSLGQGKLFETLLLNGGNEFEIEVENKKCIGKMLAMFMEFGLQLADPQNIGALVNIEPKANATDPDKIDGLPTAMQIDDRLAACRASIGNTYIYCHPALLGKLAIKYQLVQRQIGNDATGVKYAIYDWNGIPLVGSYNVNWGSEAVISL